MAKAVKKTVRKKRRERKNIEKGQKRTNTTIWYINNSIRY